MSALHLIFAQAAPAGGGSSLAPFLFQIGAIFAIFYFLMIRPQQKQRKAHEASILAIKKGDQVVTAGGIVGEVIHIKEGLKDGAPQSGLGDHITIKSGESRLVVTRGRIASVGGSEAAS
ncbi:MAG: preprotein translocase subunit YajC [Gemmatimonadaceae bacterium]|nr:preprotein translocase subunit YajC [Gemmatimonadaceae bacterium]